MKTLSWLKIPMMIQGVMMTIKPQYILFSIAMVAVVSLYSMMFYHMNILLPEVAPQNLEELHSWSDTRLMRLIQSLDCNKLPYEGVPEELTELKRVCDTTRDIWVKKHQARQLQELLDDVRDTSK